MKKILIIAAHPDDEILGCGGTILKNIKLGNKVNVLYISDGVGGRYDDKSIKKIHDINERKKMAINASKIAKFKIIDFLGLETLSVLDATLKLLKKRNVFLSFLGVNAFPNKTKGKKTNKNKTELKTINCRL